MSVIIENSELTWIKITMTSHLGFFIITFGICQVLLPPVEAANILAVQTVNSRSHWNPVQAVLRALTDRGHNVTVFTPFADADREGYTVVNTSNDLKSWLGTKISRIERSTRTLIAHIVNSSRTNCLAIFKNPLMREIVDSQSRVFDVVIVDTDWLNYMSYAANVLQIPVIYVMPSPIVTHSERSFFGHVPNPAAVSNLLFWRGVPKTFPDRFANTLHIVYGSWLLWREERRHRQIQPLACDAMELVKPSLTFTNTHFITEPSRPLSPDIVQIGGIHLTSPGQIPKDILEFIDDAPHGVIYFTFGSVVLMSSLPEDVLSVFRECFSKIPQKVLWKYEGDMKDKPKNVMTRKWFPQLHPNMKLFISHGGVSGVYETVDAGVPVLGFPIFYDQPRNIDNLVNAGMAISMDLNAVTKDKLLSAISQIVNDEKS
ncbi:UDP-glucuronosyltransferase 2B15-like, partial [Aphis craccivora]